MTDEYGPLVECEVLEGKFDSVPVFLITRPTYLSEVRNQQLIVGIMAVVYQLGY
jgi:hypothetical protein